MPTIFRALPACLLAAGLAALTPTLATAHAAHRGGAHAAAPITDADVAGLDDTGGYIWSPALAPPDGPVEIVVSLPEQRALVYRDGVMIGASAVSTGTEGRETPTGVFPILEKQVFHRSSKYDDAPMPFMERLTWYGIALHGGPLPGYAASHGCIRLPLAFARKLFGVTDVGTRVVVTDGAGDLPSLEDASATAPGPDGAPPELTPDAP